MASRVSAGTPKVGVACPRAMSTRSPADGAAAFQYRGADEIALGDDAVEHALDGGDRRVLGHQGRVHALMDAVVVALGDAQ